VYAASPGRYYNHRNSQPTCSTDQGCINGVITTCPGTTWANNGYTGCNYCPQNHYCNGTPVSCSNGQYLSTYFSASNTCSTCGAGYFCKKDWHGEVKVFPGTYATSGSSSQTACPAGRSCSASTSPSNCGTNTYSTTGNYN
jgi:hypothetical protein